MSGDPVRAHLRRPANARVYLTVGLWMVLTDSTDVDRYDWLDTDSALVLDKNATRGKVRTRINIGDATQPLARDLCLAREWISPR
jgi:hypothetical protein